MRVYATTLTRESVTWTGDRVVVDYVKHQGQSAAVVVFPTPPLKVAAVMTKVMTRAYAFT